MQRSKRAARGWLIAGALLALTAVAGCGGDGDGDAASSSEPAKPAGPEIAGSVVQYADCGDWREATRAERYATIDALRGQLTPQRAKNPSSALDDDKAYEILDKACAPANPPSLRLYKLYVKAQGFAPLND